MSTKTNKVDKSQDPMIRALYEFADNPNSLILRDFIRSQKLSEQKFTEKLVGNPGLLEAFQYAKLVIGIRREQLALDSKINTTVYRDTQPLYDDELKAWELEKKKGTLSIDDGLKKLDVIFARANKEIND